MRADAKEFPMMIVIGLVYPCNFGCPNCPYSEGNSELRKSYSELGGDYFPVDLWNKIAIEAGPYSSWLRCTGGGEPMMHPKIVEMIEFAKDQNCRIWLNTNGSLFGPREKNREKLERLIKAEVDIIEFSMDAADAKTYAKVRPPLRGESLSSELRWKNQVDNVRAALELRKIWKKKSRIVVSVIRQKIVEDNIDNIVDFWKQLGVDDVITRKFLTWDDNTNIDTSQSADKHLYQISEKSVGQRAEPCVWPFERLNIDTLGRVALCGQDISFKTAPQFPNVKETTIREIWHGEAFSKYRKLHLDGLGDTISPCAGCSAWKAGIRSWDHGWIQVLDKTKSKLETLFKEELGTEVKVYSPNA